MPEVEFKPIPVPKAIVSLSAVIAKYRRYCAWKMEHAYLKMMDR